MKETALSSGTLYPLLIRMTDQGYVEADWQSPAKPGRPPRHAYRLTALGLTLARSLRATSTHFGSSGMVPT